MEVSSLEWPATLQNVQALSSICDGFENSQLIRSVDPVGSKIQHRLGIDVSQKDGYTKED